MTPVCVLQLTVVRAVVDKKKKIKKELKNKNNDVSLDFSEENRFFGGGVFDYDSELCCKIELT